MKLFLSLLLSAVISMHVIGQNTTKFLQQHESTEMLKGDEPLESLTTRMLTRNQFIENTKQISILKSSNTDKQQLDSIIYDYWDEITEQLEIIGKEEFTYDENENLLIVSISYWNEINDRWLIFSKEDYSYDVNWNIIQHLTSIWIDSTSQWVANKKYEYNYDANGNLTEYIHSEWDDNLKNWMAKWKYENSYDAKENRTQKLTYRWVDSTEQWVFSSRIEYSYDAGGNKSQDLQYFWDDNLNQWVPIDKIVFTLDDNQNVIQSISYIYGGQYEEMAGKTEFNYNTNGDMTYYIVYSWKDSTWNEVDKEESIYDESRNIIEYVDYEWIDSTDQWVVDWKYEISYDISYLFEDLIIPFYYNKYLPYFGVGISGRMLNYNLNSMLVGYTGYYDRDENSEQWIPDEKATYYYSARNSTAIANNNKSKLFVYPNPTKDILTIQTNFIGQYVLRITSLNGQLIYRKINDGPTHQIDLSTFQQGVYLITVQSKEFIRTQRIIKL